MTAERTPPVAGIAASVLVLAVVFGPYLVLAGGELAGLRAYYSHGLVGPWAVSLLALIAVVAFAAGRENRTDPITVAGGTLVFGFVAFVISLAWAASVPGALVLQIGTADWLQYHRWLLVAASAAVFASAGWYVRALDAV
jgi:hypothetical protein